MNDQRRGETSPRVSNSSNCTMAEFFTAFSQATVLIVGCISLSVVLAVTLMFAVPPYRIWSANKSIAREEAIGMAVLARTAQEAQILIEQAQIQATVMGVLARGERSASEARAEAISTIGEAVRRYPEYAKDEYLLSLSKSLADGDIDHILHLPTNNGVPLLDR